MRVVTRHGTTYSTQRSDLSIVIGDYEGLQEKDHLGDGAYGDVKGVNLSTATKTVTKYFSFAQEHAILQLLHGCPGIVRAKQFDHGKNMIHMERYDCNLREYLISVERNPTKLHAIFANVLQGLISMYLYGLVHGDIKPLNILVNYRHVDIPTAALCDFGFTGPDNYAKTRYCTAHYLESDFTATWHSDIFALAIVFIKMFGSSEAMEGFRKRKPTSEYVIQQARRYLNDESMIELVTDMVNPNRMKRLSPIGVARRLYPNFSYPQITPLENQIVTINPEIDDIFITMGREWSLNRIPKISGAMTIYMDTCNYSYDIDLLITAFILIGSWLFGFDNGLSLRLGRKIYEANTKQKIDEVTLRTEIANILTSYPTLEYLYSK